MLTYIYILMYSSRSCVLLDNKSIIIPTTYIYIYIYIYIAPTT